MKLHEPEGTAALKEIFDQELLLLSNRMEDPWTGKNVDDVRSILQVRLLPRIPKGAVLDVSTAFDRVSDSARIWAALTWEPHYVMDSEGVESWWGGLTVRGFATKTAVAVHQTWHALFPGFISVEQAKEGEPMTDRQFAARMRSRRRRQ